MVLGVLGFVGFGVLGFWVWGLVVICCLGFVGFGCWVLRDVALVFTLEFGG